MKDIGNPCEAYDRQSKFLRDAFRDMDQKGAS